MSGDWSESLDWDDDVPELTMAEAEKAFEAGARLVRDRATFAALVALHERMADLGFSDADIAKAVNAFLDQQMKAMN
jgi:hypothetical protein